MLPLVLMAAGLGAGVGLERQWHQGLAGLRTNALVAAAACAFVHLPVATAATDVHPAALAASVITGIGFLGAGVILREGMNVRGLNTAATLWGSAAIGVYAGVGLGWDACEIAAVILGINVLLRPLIGRLNRLSAHFSTGAPQLFSCRIDCSEEQLPSVREKLIFHTRKVGLHVRSLSVDTLRLASTQDPLRWRLGFELIGYGRVEQTVERIITDLTEQVGTCGFSWSRAEMTGTDSLQHQDS